ncbi:MAG: hypothetical protein GF331_18345 [Chitinivibrionales bacterium]|nr:hypothetical protein [Chitinivibrionales bacterium]
MRTPVLALAGGMLAVIVFSAARPQAQCGNGVYGFSVTTHWTGSNNNLYGGWGDIVLHRIEDDAVTYHKTIYDGEAMFPVINLEGTQVAFIVRNGTGGKIAVCDTAGNNLRIFDGSAWSNNDSRSQGGYCDWPGGRWVYHSKGGFYDDGSQAVYRVNVDNGTCELALTFTNGDNPSGKARQWLWSMSADGSRMSLRCKDDDINSDQYGAIFYLNVPSSLPATVALERLGGTHNSHYVTGCQNAISASGTAMCYGPVSDNHRRIRIKEWWVTQNNVDLGSFDASTLHSWPPSSYNAGGEFNRNRWSNNSDDWMCAMEGWGTRGTNGCNQVLYNWREHRQLVTSTNTANMSPKQFDCAGDFHLDSCVASTEPLIGLSPSGLSFDTQEGVNPAAQQVAVFNAGSGSLGTVSANDDAAWLTVSTDGTTLTNSVNVSGLGAGTYDATVTVSASGAAESKQYGVSLTVRGAPVLTTVNVSPAGATVPTGGQVQFSATALDQFGDPLSPQPSFVWETPSCGAVTQGGLFTAPQQDGQSCGVRATATQGTITVSGEAAITVSAFLLHDDFNDGNDDGWTRGQGQWAVQNGAYVNTAQGADGNSFSYAGDSTWTDITYTLVVTPTSGGNQWVLFRVQDNDHFLLFQLSNATLYRHNGAGDWTALETGSGSFSTGQTYAISIELTGDAIAVSSNGSPVLSTTDNTFSSGMVGVGGYQSTAQFDNVIVTGATQQPAIVLVEPNGGETYRVGDTLHVRWQADLQRITSALLQVSFDEGETYYAINTDSAIEASGPDWGDYAWVIPDSIIDGTSRVSTVSSNCLIMASDYQITMSDVSSNTFAIVPADAAVMQRPGALRHGALTLRSLPDNRLRVAVHARGPHTAEVVAVDGSVVARFEGRDAATYTTARRLAGGMYVIRVLGERRSYQARVCVGCAAR